MDILDQYVHTVNTSLPKDCLLYWKAAASQDGFLTFDGFLRGFQESLKADSRFVEEAFKEKGKGMVEGICTTEELEGVLMQCNQKKLASALTKSRRDLYSSQKSEAGSRKGIQCINLLINSCHNHRYTSCMQSCSVTIIMHLYMHLL